MNDADILEPSGASRKQAAALASIAASAMLALAKLAAGLFSGSLALLSEAGHAGVDTGATILTYFAVREGGKPADEEHHYGHGKIESLAALVETGLLFGLALLVVGEAVRRFSERADEVDAGWPVFAVLGVSIVVDFVRSRQLSKVAREEGSDALAADALHFASDLISSLLVLLGLAATRFGFLQGDALAAFGVALFIAVAGYRLGRRTIDTLLDAAPQELVPHFRDLIGRVPGVIDLESLRLRQVGHEVIGEASIAVSRALSVEQAARIEAAVQRAILSDQPRAKITVNSTPRALDNETVIERVQLAAARRRISAHNVVAQQLGARLAISLDLELDATMALREAHVTATLLENAIRDEFGGDVEIESHIEPSAHHLQVGHDADATTRRAISFALERDAAHQGLVRNVHEVRVRQVDGGLVVAFHCELDPSLTVEAAHAAVDAVERRLREQFPSILRVVGHMEPCDD
ncbi:MAG TPA: cation diffusion facilitator family transporter [Methylocystis sp.]|nr:cation diffusion facilitator family transporter [Methylocystis sp.]